MLLKNPVKITLAHNGTLTNSEKLKEDLIKINFCQFNTNSDSEVLLKQFCYELYKTNFRTLTKAHVYKALKSVFQKCSGGYAVVMIVAGIGLIAFRDPKGIRPLSIGKNKDSFLIASESSAISAMGYASLKAILNLGKLLLLMRRAL
ncbi:MAG: hypothetical protein ACJZ1Y_01950 [Candidatus Neomarinimicrobiota bacterium]